jgi:hypothetical protein
LDVLDPRMDVGFEVMDVADRQILARRRRRSG